MERVTEMMRATFDVQSATVNDAMSALTKLERDIDEVSDIVQLTNGKVSFVKRTYAHPRPLTRASEKHI